MAMKFTSEIKTLEKNGWKYEYIEYDVIVDGVSTGNQYIMGDLVSDDEEDKIDEMRAELEKINPAVYPVNLSDDEKYMNMHMRGIKPIN